MATFKVVPGISSRPNQNGKVFEAFNEKDMCGKSVKSVRQANANRGTVYHIYNDTHDQELTGFVVEDCQTYKPVFIDVSDVMAMAKAVSRYNGDY